MSYTPPCDTFDVLSLFPPSLEGGLCFEEDGEPEGGGAGEPEPEPGGKQTEGMQAALAAEREKRQALEQQLAEFKAAQQKAADEAAAKRGEFEQLYNGLKAEYDPLKEQLDALVAEKTARTEALKTANEAALKELPEGLRSLVPEGLNPEQTAAQIRKLQAMQGDDGTPRGGIGPRKKPGQGQDQIPEAAIRQAKNLGYSDDNVRSYYERVWKPRQERKRGK